MCIIKAKGFRETDLSGIEHMYFVLSEPDIEDMVLVVNITDIKNSPANSDLSCVLNIGDHPHITKQSVVYYKKAREMRASVILKQLQIKDLSQIEDLPVQTLQKMQDGAKKSKLLPKKFKKYCDLF